MEILLLLSLWQIRGFIADIYRCHFQAKTTQLPNGLLQDEFEKTTVNMSTYLVAFIVADFSFVSRNVSDTLVSHFLAACAH